MAVAVLAVAVVVAFASVYAASASAAETPGRPGLYVATGDGYSIAFEVEDRGVSLLGLDATVYCSYTDPGEYFKPTLNAFFPLPTPMRRRADGLRVGEGESSEFGSDRVSVRVTQEGGVLAGKFRYSFSEESSHCQTGGYFAHLPAVPFVAARFVPVGDAEASAPSAEEPGIYFSDSGPLETFLRTEEGRVYVRGSLSSSCRFKGESDGIYPLFGSPQAPVVDAAGSFREKARYRGRIGKVQRFFEPILLSGIVGADSIAGFYSRTRVTAAGSQVQHRCGTRSAPFTAERYVPAVSPAAPG